MSLGQEVIQILCPQDVIRFEEELRSYEDHLPEVSMPVRLVRFASVVGSPVSVGFRQSGQDGQWRIIVYDTTADAMDYIYSSECDERDSKRDQTIDAWVERMLRTDAYPMLVGNEEYEQKRFRCLR